MKRTIVCNKWLALALGGVCFGTAMFHPSVSKAFTLIEKPAYLFPEVTTQPGQQLMFCTNNMAGDGSVDVLIGLVSVDDSTHFVAGTQPVTMSLNPEQGGCGLLLPRKPGGGQDTTGMPIIVLGRNVGSATGGGGAGKGLVSSVQLIDADGSVKLVTTPTLMDGVAVPTPTTSLP